MTIFFDKVGGIYGNLEVIKGSSIFGSSYVIYIVTTLLDTPIPHFARKISDKRKAKAIVNSEA